MSHMPLMVNLERVTVFGGERGEGLQKTQKLALFADELLVVAEARGTPASIDLPAGPQSELKEKLVLPAPRSIPVHPQTAGDLDDEALRSLITGRSFVVSDLADRAVNERIFRLAGEEHVLCTVVDTKDLCTAWFMGLIRTDRFTAALSSNGTSSPTGTDSRLVPRLRQYLTPLIEDWKEHP